MHRHFGNNLVDHMFGKCRQRAEGEVLILVEGRGQIAMVPPGEDERIAAED
jgi:hypothetical protein